MSSAFLSPTTARESFTEGRFLRRKMALRKECELPRRFPPPPPPPPSPWPSSGSEEDSPLFPLLLAFLGLEVAERNPAAAIGPERSLS